MRIKTSCLCYLEKALPWLNFLNRFCFIRDFGRNCRCNNSCNRSPHRFLQLRIPDENFERNQQGERHQTAKDWLRWRQTTDHSCHTEVSTWLLNIFQKDSS